MPRTLIGLLCCTALSACAVDAIVFKQPHETSSEKDAGQAEPEAPDGSAPDRSLIWGCDAANAGGVGEIFESIVSNTREAGDWLRPDRNCEADRDCRATLLTPACNVETAFCQACPDITERVTYNMLLARCLVSAIARCCGDPSAAQDCVFRDCVSGCGPQ